MFSTVRMTATAKGSPDGLSVREFEAGQVYDIPEALAMVFVNVMQVAERVDERVEIDNQDAIETPESAAPVVQTTAIRKRKRG